MNSVVGHYETHLAPIYLWMVGGIEHALALGNSDVSPLLDRTGVAVDLGAGFGMHSIPLARAGFEVLAVDSSQLLLAELRKHSVGLDVTTIEADLLEFATRWRQQADLILCMGDTLTHLQSVGGTLKLSQIGRFEFVDGSALLVPGMTSEAERTLARIRVEEIRPRLGPLIGSSCPR